VYRCFSHIKFAGSEFAVCACVCVYRCEYLNGLFVCIDVFTRIFTHIFMYACISSERGVNLPSVRICRLCVCLHGEKNECVFKVSHIRFAEATLLNLEHFQNTSCICIHI